jgi:hypothetical protein
MVLDGYRTFIGVLMISIHSYRWKVLSLPSFVWKPLVGERVSWSRDFHTVDLAQVKLLERLQNVDRETFDTKFGGVLTFTAVSIICI